MIGQWVYARSRRGFCTRLNNVDQFINSMLSQLNLSPLTIDLNARKRAINVDHNTIRKAILGLDSTMKREKIQNPSAWFVGSLREQRKAAELKNGHKPFVHHQDATEFQSPPPPSSMSHALAVCKRKGIPAQEALPASGKTVLRIKISTLKHFEALPSLLEDLISSIKLELISLPFNPTTKQFMIFFQLPQTANQSDVLSFFYDQDLNFKPRFIPHFKSDMNLVASSESEPKQSEIAYAIRRFRKGGGEISEIWATIFSKIRGQPSASDLNHIRWLLDHSITSNHDLIDDTLLHMMEVCWKCNIKSSQVGYLWEKLLTPIADRAVPRTQMKALRLALMLDPLHYEEPASKILSRVRLSLQMFNPSTLANLVSLLTEREKFHLHPFFTHPRQSVLAYFSSPVVVGKLSNEERFHLLSNFLRIYLPKEIDRGPPVMFDPPPQCLMQPDLVGSLRMTIDSLTSRIHIERTIPFPQIETLLSHLALFRIQIDGLLKQLAYRVHCETLDASLDLTALARNLACFATLNHYDPYLIDTSILVFHSRKDKIPAEAYPNIIWSLIVFQAYRTPFVFQDLEFLTYAMEKMEVESAGYSAKNQQLIYESNRALAMVSRRPPQLNPAARSVARAMYKQRYLHFVKSFPCSHSDQVRTKFKDSGILILHNYLSVFGLDFGCLFLRGEDAAGFYFERPWHDLGWFEERPLGWTQMRRNIFGTLAPHVCINVDVL